MIAAACATSSCRKRSSTATEAPRSGPSAGQAINIGPHDPRSDLEVRDWTFPAVPGEVAFERRAVVLIPKSIATSTKLPLLIALHGMGETVDSTTGANGWLQSYGLDVTLMNLHAPPLTTDAFKGFVTNERLAVINDGLAKRPFGGMIIACPYQPAGIGTESLGYDTYASFLADRLLPRLRAETPVIGTPRSTGIDGVSYGGLNALRMGMMRPEVFGAVGALQAAVYDEPTIVALIAERLGGRPLHLVTSAEDVYLPALTTVSKGLEERKVPHEFVVTQGPHGYDWNKGTGAIEMLLWHDRVLRG